MRRLPISAFATLALLLAACQSLPAPVPVVVAPEPPAPVAPAAPEVAVETPTRLLPAYDADTSAPAAPVVEAVTPAPTVPEVVAETPAPAAPVVMAETPAPAAPVVMAETPAPVAPVVVAETPAPAAPRVAAVTPTRPLPVEPPLRRGPIILAAGQSAQIGSGAALRFESLESDSRCQPKVQCIWAGEVTLFFILQGEASTAGFELSSTTKSKATALGRAFELTAYGPCPEGTAGECATITASPAP